MKSAAFNLAFKVHRNEVQFAEGLLKAVEADAQEDFIEALNSLAGQTKYNIEQLDQLIAKAKGEVSGEAEKPSVDVEALEKEIRDLKQDVTDLKGSIHFIEAKNQAMMPTIVPGINSLMLFILGLVIMLIMFAMSLIIPTIIAFVATLGACAALFMMDMGKLTQQKEAIARKQEKNLAEIDKIKGRIEETNKKIIEKQGELAKAQPKKKEVAPPQPTPDDGLPPIG